MNTRAAITPATGDLWAVCSQPLWAPTLPNPPTGSPGPFLHPASGPDPGPSPHTPSRAPSHCPPTQTTPGNPSSRALPGVGPLWGLVKGLRQPPPVHYGYPQACGYTLRQALGAESHTALLPVHPRDREAGDALARGGVYISGGLG